MEYSIGTVQRGGTCRMILKTKGLEHTDYRKGRITLEKRQGNITVKDTFSVIQKYQTTETTDGNMYDWYYIEDHFRQEDRTEEVRVQLEQTITDLEIDSIQQDMQITDNEIAIMELQEAQNV